MRFGSVLAFAAGALVGSIVTSIHFDDKETPAKKTEEKKENPKDKSENGYKEKTSIDGYTVISQEDMTAYDKIVKDYEDPASMESPEEGVTVEENEHRMRGPIEISKLEYSTFGYETQEFYYDPETKYVWEDGCEPIDDDDRIRMFGNLLEDGFDDESKQVMYIRNFKLMTDFAIYINTK